MKGMVFGILAACVLAWPTHAAEVDKLLPDDAGAVVCVNVRQVLDSALMKKHGQARAEAALKSGHYIQKLFTPAGFDPLRDLTLVTVVFPANNDPKKGLMIVHGKFDQDRISTKAEEIAKEKDSSVKISVIDRHSVYEISSSKEQVGKAYIVVLDANTLVAAPDRGSIEEALAKHAGKRASKVKRILQKMIEDEDIAQSVWVVVPEGKFLASAKLAADDKVKEVLGRIDSLRLGIAVNTGVQLKATIATTSVDDAKAIKKDFDGALESTKAVIILVSENRPELAPLGDILETITLKHAANVLLLEGSASAAVLDKALEKAIRPPSRP